MTTLNLDELERLLAEATPVPWEAKGVLLIEQEDVRLAVAAVNALHALIAAARERDAFKAECERFRNLFSYIEVNGPNSDGEIWFQSKAFGFGFNLGPNRGLAITNILEFEKERRAALEEKP